MAPPSLRRDCLERIEEAVDVEGVETDRSSWGTASSARDGETEGEGEEGRCCGEVALLAGGLETVSAIFGQTRIVARGCLVSLQFRSFTVLVARQGEK